jgi:hypothetical protein
VTRTRQQKIAGAVDPEDYAFPDGFDLADWEVRGVGRHNGSLFLRSLATGEDRAFAHSGALAADPRLAVPE